MTETTGGYAFAALIAEAEALTFAEFTFRDAVELGMHASKKALAADLPVIIQVTFGSRLAYFAALPGSSADSELWIQRKARVVERFGISTLAARVQYEEQDTTFAEATGLCEDEYAKVYVKAAKKDKGRFQERCQALSPLPPLPVTPGQHLDHLGCSSSLRQTTGPGPRAVRGQQQGLNTPPSGRKRCYSSLPSKHWEGKQQNREAEGFRVPPIPATPGRTQPTPSASRSVGAELAGVAISIFGIRFTSFQ